jgi:hypothetical protein
MLRVNSQGYLLALEPLILAKAIFSRQLLFIRGAKEDSLHLASDHRLGIATRML